MVTAWKRQLLQPQPAALVKVVTVHAVQVVLVVDLPTHSDHDLVYLLGAAGTTTGTRHLTQTILE